MPISSRYRPRVRIQELGEELSSPVEAARFPKHVLRFRNQRWADRVGLGDLTPAEWEAHFATFARLPDNLEKPLALRYHGHQGESYDFQLSDYQGFLFAQLEDDAGRLLDLGTKGSGPTPWSRGFDGRLTLKNGVREVLASEMLEAIGVSTAKALSLFETGEELLRGDEPSPARSSVLVRLSHSLIRVGTFQRLAHLADADRLGALLEYTIASYLPGVEPGPRRVERFLQAVARANARLCAGWMLAGFVHGALGSDLTNVTGEGFEYGPYRFLPSHPDLASAQLEQAKPYGYFAQPSAMARNIGRLAAAVRFIEPDVNPAAVTREFERIYKEELARATAARLGLASRGQADAFLAEAVRDFLAASDVGFEQLFFDLQGGLAYEKRALAGPSREAYAGPAWQSLRQALAGYEPAGEVSAYFDRERPATLLPEEIDAIWNAIAERDDWAPFEHKIAELRERGAA
jgi:uncharacterized protein YdiU (UPF0061 family)